ncbi:MAG: hypothetical protein F4Z32_16560, partial [Gemmatimonadetes bacterium]|nr:hypothetical protein [Gemmatimonadota bacterium]
MKAARAGATVVAIVAAFSASAFHGPGPDARVAGPDAHWPGPDAHWPELDAHWPVSGTHGPESPPPHCDALTPTPGATLLPSR